MEELPDILYNYCDIVQGDTETYFDGFCEHCYRHETCKNAYIQEHQLLH